MGRVDGYLWSRSHLRRDKCYSSREERENYIADSFIFSADSKERCSDADISDGCWYIFSRIPSSEQGGFIIILR